MINTRTWPEKTQVLYDALVEEFGEPLEFGVNFSGAGVYWKNGERCAISQDGHIFWSVSMCCFIDNEDISIEFLLKHARATLNQ